MDSNSQSASSAERYSHRLADVVGTAIAMLTLTLPMFVIAHYSSNNIDDRQPIIYKVDATENATLDQRITNVYAVRKE